MKPEKVNIAIVRIKEVEYFINEPSDSVVDSDLNVNFQVVTKLNHEDKTIEILLTAQYVDKSSENVLLKIKTSNLFTVLELVDFYEHDKNTYDIPDNVMVTLLSLSVSHTRALLAKNAQGTKFEKYIIPIINPNDLFNKLFKV